MRTSNSNAHRFLGVELSGAKNTKTAIAAIEFYPRERKTFLLDIYDRVSPLSDESGDEALLNLVRELQSQARALAINVPATLPPCITCTRKKCPLPAHCSVPEVKWMREQSRKALRTSPNKNIDFTPYTQRPVELWARHHLLPTLADSRGMEVDEALGGNRAPLTARLAFLSRHLGDLPILEVWPKWSVALLASRLGLHRRLLSSYRKLEEGVQARTQILEALIECADVFIYERDLKTLAQSLPAFDSFVCAYTALLHDQGLCVPPPKGFPKASGWLTLPQVKKLTFSKREDK